MVDIRWVWLFLHHEDARGDDARADQAWSFWAEVTGSTLSPRRGDRGEFATLVPEQGDGWVKLQRTLEGDGVHVDLVVEDVDAAAAQAQALGATQTDSYGGVRVMRSPGGFVFCFTDWQAEGRPSVQVRDGAVLLDQVCLDIPRSTYDDEVGFWSRLLGWEVVAGGQPEFSSLARPAHLPVRFLLQRTDATAGVVTGHPDVACQDRSSAVARWVDASAVVVAEREWWTVLRDPAGLIFCLTDRDPLTGHR